MPTMNETPETVTAPAPAETVKAKKPTKTKKKANPKTDSQPLKRRQFLILAAIDKNGDGALTRKRIMEKVFNGNSVNLSNDIGASDPKDRPAKEKESGYPSLLTLKYIKQIDDLDTDGHIETGFEITGTGRKALTKGCQDSRIPPIGTVIEREYKGDTHKVKVLASGFEYKKEKYTSLTSVAKAIIGSDSEINGFAFFKLTKSD